MIDVHRALQFAAYTKAHAYFTANPNLLIELEALLTKSLEAIISASVPEIAEDYNEASHLYPFWANYPPDDRGRSPIADQYPWIEVGEHAIGSKLSRLLHAQYAEVRDTGFPSGADQRFVLRDPVIANATGGFTDSVWLFLDIKSVGPRDDQSHTVMSHNQVTGDGIWIDPKQNLKNTTLVATGNRTTHDFYPSLPPLVVLSDTRVMPIITIAIKPVYSMLATTRTGIRNEGQPLKRIDIACVPNGILLLINPNYLKTYPGLLFPGKDDKSKNPLKLRARVSFDKLKQISAWRVRTIPVP